MSRRSLFNSAALVLAILALARPASAGVQTYIALGDSGAFGVGANDSATDISNGDRGYVGPFADILGARQGGTRPNLFNLGISGETTSSFFQGYGLGGPGAVTRNTNYDNLNPIPTQNSLLLTTIADQTALQNTISTVTIQLGANDLSAVADMPGFFNLPPDQQQALILQTLGVIQANDTKLLTELRGLLPSAQLIMMGYYDPYAPFRNDPTSPFYPIAQAAAVAIPALNQVIAGEAAAFGGVYVDEYTPFVGNELAYTYIASGNEHANGAGYAAITAQLAAATVPEPGSIVMVASGAACLLLFARQRRGGRRPDPAVGR